MGFQKSIISIAAYALFTSATGLFCLQNLVQAQTPVKASEAVTLNFQGAEIEAVARTFASITGRNVVVDPRVKGTLTLVSDQPVSRAAALGQFVAALRLQGYTLVESGGLYKVVPEAEAKLQSAGVNIQDERATNVPTSNQIATQIFKLNHESANNLVAVLRPLISPNNTINANPGTNSLVITDYGDNLRRLSLIIAALDVANATDAEVIALQHALASDLAPLVQRLMGVGGSTVPAGTAENAFKTTVMAEPRANALIVRAANGAQLALVRSLIHKLDQPDANRTGAAGNIHVVYLKNADATKLAVTLRAAISSAASPAAAPTGAPSTPAAPAVTTGGQIQADASTNSLIITAPEPQYRQLRAVIDQLDARRAQVFVESLIAEVSMDKAAEFGIQWQGPLGNAGSGVVGLLGSNFGIGGKNIISLATGAATGTVVPGRGLNVGAAQQVNGVYVLGFLARFLEDSGSGNVLSTPNLLTLDNEEAKIVIGQNVPFVTGQFTSTGATTGGTVNPFQTIERKDVGLTLKVKPQISENGTVKLAIYQEVSNVLASSVNAPNGPTTNKRTIESNVLVEDGAIVVLGGLLQDEYAGNQEKVPGLADVPLFGNLFKSEARSRKKTNLMVFLRPVVVRDARATDKLSMDRYDLMRSGMQDAQPTPSTLVPVNQAPVLPALVHQPAAVATPAGQ
ncbi:type II secretion system secretin GspD [Rhodoferax sp.]|uniref:type II secretion system secretin GspD n=1 Tax=Rhodoferax sp. TaxID=50421 RepID=UPI00262F63A5|nr:type II secretion system secretin GspD [Rhodoferax sp.]MDD5481195.1 type II secretion system secretin GspD [Rhodoferax sp.]